MCWYSYKKRKCLKCGFEFEEEASTLEIAKGNYGLCPECNSETEIIQVDEEKNNFIEEINKIF